MLCSNAILVFASVRRLFQRLNDSSSFVLFLSVNLEGDLFCNDFKRFFGKILSNSNLFLFTGPLPRLPLPELDSRTGKHLSACECTVY